MNAKEAFAALLKISAEELQKVQQKGAAYFASGDTTHVREAADRVEKIQILLLEIRELKEHWELIIPDPVQDTVQPIPPQLQIERTPPGQKTPPEQYWVPILQVLVEMGGKGPTGRVLDLVGELMQNILSDFDCELLPARHDIRWRNTAMWARLEMVKAGYLRDRSPRGIWEITEEGRKYLANRSAH